MNNYPFALLLILIFVLPLTLFLSRKKKLKKVIIDFNMANIPVEGTRIPLLASFRGIKGVSLIAFAYNNIFPRLTIYNDKIKFQVIFPTTKKFDQVEKVDIFRTIGTENLRIILKDSPLTFDGNIFDREVLKSLISFFKAKGVIVSEKAEKFLANT